MRAQTTTYYIKPLKCLNNYRAGKKSSKKKLFVREFTGEKQIFFVCAMCNIITQPACKIQSSFHLNLKQTKKKKSLQKYPEMNITMKRLGKKLPL